MNNLIIGISGFATSGKDTCASLISSYLNKLGKKTKIFSFASCLKEDIDDFCVKKINISALTTDPVLKSKIRPILISYGQIQRNLSKGTYWINQLDPAITSFFKYGGEVAIISDLRFKEFEYDELDYLKSYNNNIIVNVERIDKNGQTIKAAHESENSSHECLRQASDVKISWESSQDETYLNEKIFNLIDLINLKLNIK